MKSKLNSTMNSDRIWQTISLQFLDNWHSRLSEWSYFLRNVLLSDLRQWLTSVTGNTPNSNFCKQCVIIVVFCTAHTIVVLTFCNCAEIITQKESKNLTVMPSAQRNETEIKPKRNSFEIKKSAVNAKPGWEPSEQNVMVCGSVGTNS